MEKPTRKPPPLPPTIPARAPSPPPIPPPSARRPAKTEPPGRTTQAKQHVASVAMRVREEQLKARVVYFGADQQTNSELDAITDQVLEDLRSMQAGAAPAKPPADRGAIEIELIRTLRTVLEKAFSSRRESFIRARLEAVQRRVTALFFAAELDLDATSGAQKTFTHADQALFHALDADRDRLVHALQTFSYADEAVRTQALAELEQLTNRLRVEVLKRTTPELERLLVALVEVIGQFCFAEFPRALGEFCWEVIREARIAHVASVGYKIEQAHFEAFRRVFESKFLERLVHGMQEPLIVKLGDKTRDETLAFVTDPSVYSEIATVLCEATYDYMHGEGFLDLPPQWRTHLYEQNR